MRPSSLTLRVMDLPRVSEFYTTVLGFHPKMGEKGEMALSASPQGETLLRLITRTGLRPRSPSLPGLFHVAYLLPNRQSLADLLRRIVARNYPIGGAADHLVSHALYLDDPEGNGIELSYDLPREAWPRAAEGIEMATLALDVESLYTQGREGEALDARSTIGHLHLQVSDLVRSGHFYQDILGLEVTQQNYPGALFLSSGGYHHHIGLNVWRSRGAPPAPFDVTGIDSFTVRAGESVPEIRKRAKDESTPVTGDMLLDPDGIPVFLER